MDAQTCLHMLREIREAAFATVDEKGFPQVRIIDVMMTEGNHLYFCTARGKDFYRQLTENGRVAITSMNQKYQMIRLSGTARRLDEQKKWIDLIFENNPSMNQVYPGESRYVLEAFCVDQGQVEFFDLGREPIVRECFSLDGSAPGETGFSITGDCIRCGLCREICPQKCIRDFVIDQTHCLHCGLCYEKCPAKAVRKRGA